MAMRHPATWTALVILAVLTLIVLATPADAASPSVTARSATAVTTTTATLHAGVNPHGLPTTFAFEYGPTRAYGLRTPTRSAGAGTTRRDVAARIAGLTPGVRYHFRVVAANADGTTVGTDRSFRTALPPATPPAVLATAPFAPYANSVTLTAELNPGAAETTYRFQFGTTTAYGQETLRRTLAAGVLPRSVRIAVSGLRARTSYHFRVVASNRAGTTFGPDVAFRTGPFRPTRLAVSARPHRQRRSHPFFVVSGVLRLPPAVSVADGCGGVVEVRFSSRRRTVAERRVRMAAGHCSFRVRMRALPPQGRRLLRVHARFDGNALLTPRAARSFRVGFRS
jgi:hypothetical protein